MKKKKPKELARAGRGQVLGQNQPKGGDCLGGRRVGGVHWEKLETSRNAWGGKLRRPRGQGQRGERKKKKKKWNYRPGGLRALSFTNWVKKKENLGKPALDGPRARLKNPTKVGNRGEWGAPTRIIAGGGWGKRLDPSQFLQGGFVTRGRQTAHHPRPC